MATKTKRTTKKQDLLPNSFTLTFRRTKAGWRARSRHGASDGEGTFALMESMIGALKQVAAKAGRKA